MITNFFKKKEVADADATVGAYQTQTQQQHPAAQHAATSRPKKRLRKMADLHDENDVHDVHDVQNEHNRGHRPNDTLVQQTSPTPAPQPAATAAPLAAARSPPPPAADSASSPAPAASPQNASSSPAPSPALAASSSAQSPSASSTAAPASHPLFSKAGGGSSCSAAAAGLTAIMAAKLASNAKTTGVDVRAYEQYDPSQAATWSVGTDVPYAFLAETFSLVEETSGRLAITVLVANCIRTILATTPSQLYPVIALCTNKIAASYEGIELGVGDTIMIRAVAETCGRSVEAVKSQLESMGDLGEVALASRKKQITFGKPKPMSAVSVLKTLREIAQSSGKDVQSRKKDMVKKMLVSAQGKEACYIVRALQGKMRLGLAESTVLVALAHAVTVSPAPGTPEASSPCPSGSSLAERLAAAEEEVKKVYCEMPSLEVMCRVLLEHGIGQLHAHAHLTAGFPVKPMLAKPTKGISEVLDRMSSGRFTCEFKYDGERAQIHRLADGTFKIFSRNSEDMSSKYPDVGQMLPEALREGVTSFILDAEAVAIDRCTGAIRPFQVLSTRKRKDASIDDISVQVCIFAFDLLYLNGEPLLRRPLAARRELLRASFHTLPHRFDFARSSDVADEDGIADWLQEAVRGNCEGLMVKTLDENATYEPSRRSLNWLKVKKDYLQGMTDSCDLVPIGGYYGKGKRTGVYGAFLLACYNDEDEEYQSVCKIGTGFSDSALVELAKSLNEKRIEGPRAYYRVPETDKLTPDVWFEPCQVWEVLAADLSISPVHLAAVGVVDDSKGIALRFPRFIRVRDDKGPEDSTLASQIAQMYSEQACTKSGDRDDDDD